MRFCPALVLLVPTLLAAQTAPRLARDPAASPAVAAQPTKPEDLCALSGRIVNASTGEPIRRASIILMRADPTPGEPPLAYSTASDSQGAFAMKDVEPGKYRLTASRNGF